MLMVNQLAGFGAYQSGIVPVFGTVFSATLGSTGGGNATVTFRSVFAIAGLTVPSGTPTSARVSFQAGTSGGEGMDIAAAYIGHKAGAGDPYDFAATPVQLLFAGSGTKSIASGATAVSDNAAFAWDKTSDLIVSWYCTNAAQDSAAFATVANQGTYTIVANDPATVNTSGYGGPTAGPRLDLISKIETDGF